eukprot:6431008-Alexandrium_andersonii.AAC.1
MSASLVGSEMCIRDSRSCLWVRVLCAPLPAGAPCTRSHTRDAIACAPVSYTHLTLPTICSV